MKIKNLFPSLVLTLFSICFLASNAYSQSCPSGAICRNDEAPGKYSRNGPYNVDDYDMPFGSTPGGASVYYPTNATPPFAVLVFTPPLSGTQFMYRDWGPFFASHGIVMVTMDTRTTSDSVDSRASQQADVLDAMKDENTRYGSPLRGKIATNRLGAVGWSMGGGATWINSAEYNGLTTAMSLAGHNLTAINSNSRGRNTRVPTLIMNGALDLTILGGLGQSDGVYSNIPYGVPKVFYEVRSAGHFDWGSPTAANDATAELALAFQKTFLEGDTRWARFITRPIFDVSEWESANIPN
ncbi:Poly(ethylene terephthalate) hydrolase [Thalassocella blandensis]|nr:Poly(ethylene terephthalate) hydrolase [Thalassocella blandensis]